MQVEPWEVWFANVRFEDETGTKDRPVIITESGTVFVLALFVTSHVPRNNWGEVELIKWQYAGLNRPSTVRVTRQLELLESDLRKRIGKLHPIDILQIQRYIDAGY